VRLRDIHKYLSYAIIIVAAFSTVTGVRSYNLNRKQLPHFWIAPAVAFVVPWIVMEIRHQIFLRTYVDLIKPTTVMTEEEFYTITRKGRRHLLLIDDLVVDATDYAPYHPGGKFIIERTRGTDISKFFYGGYNLEPQNNGQNYNHTNYARLAINEMIVGVLVRNVNISMVKIAGESLASQD